MCARIFRLLLAALFVFVVVTVAAFVYLDWWQAILASAATFLLLLYGGKVLVRTAVGRAGELAKGLFEAKSVVLRGATVDVHAVRPAEPPPEVDAETDADDLRWYSVEATVFPDPARQGPMTRWDLDDLCLVPAGAPARVMFQGGDDDTPEFPLHTVELVVDGDAVIPDGPKLAGPQRLRFVAGVPREVRAVTFRYHFEQFGLVTLPQAMLGPPPT